MKTLLIPTDFDLKSLNCIPKLVQKYYPEQLDIVLVHMLKITDSISELLMLSRRSAEYKHISDDFYRMCLKLKEKHAGQINNIRIEFFYGSTIAVFKNFLDNHCVDTVVTLEDYDYQLLNKNSIEPASFLNRCGKHIVTVDCRELEETTVPQTEQVLVEQEV